MDSGLLTSWIKVLCLQLKKSFETVGIWRASFIFIVICSWFIKPSSHFHSLESDDYEDLFYPFSFQSIQNSIIEFIIQVLIPIWYTLQASFSNDYFQNKSVLCPNLDNDYHCPNCANTIKRLLDAKKNMATKEEIQKIVFQLNCIQKLNEENKYFSIELSNLKKEIKNQSNLIFKVNKINSILDIQGRKIENIKNHYPLMDENKKKTLIDMFKSAETSVDFLKRRDDQLKELFKTTTDLTLKNDKFNEDMKNMKKSFNELLKHIKLNNEDFAKFVEYSGSIVEESIFKKVKSDLLGLTNEFEQLRSELFNKLTLMSKMEEIVNNLTQNFQKVMENVSHCDERLSNLFKEINEFKDEIEKLSVLLHTDIEGKINGILKFMGKSSNNLIV